MSEKKYQVGMYGGKFFPMHKGHKHCIDLACAECEKAYIILFINGTDEEQYLATHPYDEQLTVDFRVRQLLKVCNEIPNAIPCVIDVSGCRNEDGTEDWHKETPLVRKFTGDRIDACYGSENAYGDYFYTEYPETFYRIVDVDRTEVPISATKVRNMNSEERKQWVI